MPKLSLWCIELMSYFLANLCMDQDKVLVGTGPSDFLKDNTKALFVILILIVITKMHHIVSNPVF